ncbi:MAG: winged helix-turn-helix transcriptional regulator, partial [Winogradskyella sp.]|nr:winged helix-turn-helix transcriptional regulator [Winogradskyella sp.]
MGIVTIKNGSGLPKYRQIVNSIEKAIAEGTLKKGNKLPSLNSIKNKHNVSRDTVLTAFNDLKTRGIVESIVGKGYYVLSENVQIHHKIFLLFDEFNSFKEDLYNSFIETLGVNIQVDLFFHHFNTRVFSNLINDNLGDYSYYVVMPANIDNTERVINRLPHDKVFILDQTNDRLNQYPAVYQNFEKDIFKGLEKVDPLLKKYNKLILLFEPKKQPQGILKGFKLFCESYNYN